MENQKQEPQDDSLPEFMRQESPNDGAARVISEASSTAEGGRRPFSRPPKGANQAAIVLLIAFLLIWIAIKVFS